MTDMDWPNRTTAELLEELADRQNELRAHYDAYDALLQRGTKSLSLADRSQHMYELGEAMQALKLFIAGRYVDELEADARFMETARLKHKMLTIAEIEAVFAQASEYLQAREFHLAVAELNNVVRHNPLLGEAYYNRGLAFLRGGAFDRAIIDFSTALRLNPDFMEAWLNRGMAHSDLQQYPQAIRDLTEALGLDPYNLRACVERGIALKHEKRYLEALADMDRALQLAPEDAASLLYERAQVYEAAGDTGLAMADYESALDYRPGWNVVAQKIAGLRQKS